MTKQTTIVVIGALRVKTNQISLYLEMESSVRVATLSKLFCFSSEKAPTLEGVNFLP